MMKKRLRGQISPVSRIFCLLIYVETPKTYGMEPGVSICENGWGCPELTHMSSITIAYFM